MTLLLASTSLSQRRAKNTYLTHYLYVLINTNDNAISLPHVDGNAAFACGWLSISAVADKRFLRGRRAVLFLRGVLHKLESP